MVIDWDLEAPGLHRFFHPFIEDTELSMSLGIIDFLIDFVEGARTAHSDYSEGADERWFESYIDLLPYAFSLDWEFPKGGTIDFVPAGQQGAGYGVRVMTFDWQGFYEKLGGGVFLEAVKHRLRVEYDYVLIDSRTGISDTAGICNVQMPDDLVVCFTFNNQSIRGAAAVAESAVSQRLKPTGEPGLRVWPVPTRVELAEKDRLEAARDATRQAFQRYLRHLSRYERQRYWGRIEVPYDAFFAFEEVLATFSDRRRHNLSVLATMEALTSYLTDGTVSELGDMSEQMRIATLAKFTRVRQPSSIVPLSSQRQIYLSYTAEDRDIAHEMGQYLNRQLGEGSVVWDELLLLPGDPWKEKLQTALHSALAVIVLVTPRRLVRGAESHASQEVISAQRADLRIIPVLFNVSWSDLAVGPEPFPSLFDITGVTLSFPPSQEDMIRLTVSLRRILETASPTLRAAALDVDDPQKGQWGGRTSHNGRTLRGWVRELSANWFEVTLEVAGQPDRPLESSVEFHLHPIFSPLVRTVPVLAERATLKLSAWGAFTVGAVTDEGRTRLELDLAELQDAPQVFRER